MFFNHVMKTGGRTFRAALRQSNLFDLHSKHKMCDFEQWDYTTTVIREPTERLLSHYKMLMQNRMLFRKMPPHRHARRSSDDANWPGENFESFLDKFPNEWRIHQLYFYSETGDVNEAFDNVIKNTQIVLSEEREEGLRRLAIKTGNDPKVFTDVEPPDWQTTKSIKFKPSEYELACIKDVLKDEYVLYKRVLEYYKEEKI